MKSIYLFLLLLSGCVLATSFDYKLKVKKEITPSDSIILDNNQYILFKTDSFLYTQTMIHKYTELGKKIIEVVDSVEVTPYQSNIYILEATKNRSFILFWETQYENIPITNAYYLFKNKFVKIGEFKIFKKYNNSETYIFPIKEILIKQENNIIKFLFTKEVYYDVGNADEKLINANEIIYIYDIQKEKIMCQF